VIATLLRVGSRGAEVARGIVTTASDVVTLAMRGPVLCYLQCRCTRGGSFRESVGVLVLMRSWGEVSAVAALAIRHAAVRGRE
jgi:hypothetical protein